MIIYLDENLPKYIAEGFETLQRPEGFKKGGFKIEVKYIPTEFHHGVKDLEWIPKVGKQGACVITKDVNISRRKQELELYQKCGVGMFFLKGHSKKQPLNTWETVQALAKHWPEISRIAHEEKRPFGYEFSLNGKLKRVQ